MIQELNGWIFDKDDERALTMCFLRKVEKWEKGSRFLLEKCTEDEVTLQSAIKTNRKMTRVMLHKCFWATYQNFVYLTTSVFLNRHPINLVTVYSTFQPSSHWACHRSRRYFSRQPMNIEPSACNYLTITPIGPLSQIKTDQNGWRGQLKRIKMRSDGPGKMGLTDPCPWVEKRQAHLL